MNTKKTLLILIAVFAIGLSAHAQKGNNQLQLGGQVAFPTGDLGDGAKTGFGGYAKGMYGFGVRPQQVTLEAGYNRFTAKNTPSGIDASFSAIPIYTGYRYILGNFTLEPQAGISINKVAASFGGTSASDTNTNFAWATSVGYMFDKVELGLKYQSSEASGSDINLTFVSVRIGYNF